MRPFANCLFPALLGIGLAMFGSLKARAGGPMGVDGGVVVSGSTINLTPTVASNYVAAKTGWVRVNMILPSGHTTWDSTALGYYDQAIDNARAAGLQVLMLLNNQGWTGGQSSWNANNYETTGGNGDNPYIDGWVSGVVSPLLQHFHDRVKVWEIWNEPSTWSSSSTNAGVISYSGASYMYPSCYSWLLSKSWLAAHVTLGFSDVKIISGGVFGTSPLGASDPGGNSGSNYVAAFYRLGTSAAIGAPFTAAKTSYGTYPVDGIGQHLYIDYNINTTSADVQQYLGLIRGACLTYEGVNTTKKTYVTEIGWTTAIVSQQTQANNLATAFGVFETGGSYVAMAIWFNWQDGGAGDYGIFDASGDPKIAWTNYVFDEQYEGYHTNGTVETNLLNYFNTQGQRVYGDAFDNGSSAFVHTVSGGGASAQAQDFAGGSHTNVTIFDSGPAGQPNATHELNDLHGLWSYYNSHGGAAVFGPPQNNEYATTTGTRQDFAAGSLVWSSAGGLVTTASLTASPLAGTEPATRISAATATLNGLALANGTNAATAWFEWGTNSSYGRLTPVTNFGGGFQITLLSAPITGLNFGLVYHFRLTISNSLALVHGADRMFTTGSHMKAWGDNTYGQTNLPTPLTNAVCIASGGYHGLALENNGSVMAWGLNASGETAVPVSLTNAVALAAGLTHSLALKGDGTVAAWGGNSFGQTSIPPGLTNVVAITAGAYHNLALKSDGTVTAWGSNNDGQTNVPAGLGGVIGVAAGQYHSLALLANGTVLGWGDNTYGQTNVPVTLSNVTAICAGQYHNLALRGDGTVTVWGRNNLGQTNLPAGLTNVAAIGCGDNYNLVLRSDGTLVAWGDNSEGQTNLPANLGQVTQLAGGMGSGFMLGSQLPGAASLTANGYVNHDLLISLNGTAGDGGTLSFRITSLPVTGKLYQSAAGWRGAAITVPGTVVTNLNGQVIYVGVTNQTGAAYDGFNFVANDSLNDSATAAVAINIGLPPMPALINPAWIGSQGNKTFALTFASVSNATYKVWASTNLTDWQLDGTATETGPGQYEFFPAGIPQGECFYELAAP